MTATAIRIPRRLVRKALKQLCLWLNACSLKHTDFEIARIRSLREHLARAETRQNREKTRLVIKRRRIEGW